MISSLVTLATLAMATQGQQPDVLVVVYDDVSAVEIETHIRDKYAPIIPGGAFPNLDSLEASGTRFDRMYVARWCKPTRRMAFMSKWAGNIIGNICANQPPFLNRSAPMLAKSMDSAGYQTAAFGKWHLGGNNLCPFECTPQMFGFNTIRAGVPEDTTACVGKPGGNYFDWLRWEDGTTFRETKYQTLAIVEEFENWELETRGRGPRFAWVALQAAHSPYHIPPDELLPPAFLQSMPPDPTDRQKYELMVLSQDVALGRILDSFQTPPWVVLITDNGTPGDVAEPYQRANRVKNSNFEGGIRAYCVVSGPGLPARADSTVLSCIDIFPTLMGALSLPTPPILQGQNFAPLLFGQTAARRGYATANPDNTNPWRRPYAVETRYKIHRDLVTPYPWGVDALYDLLLDPDELTPMDPATGPSAIVGHLQAVLDGRGVP